MAPGGSFARATKSDNDRAGQESGAMGRAFATAAGVCLIAFMAGCTYEGAAPRPRPTASIKPPSAKAIGARQDDVKPALSETEQARAAQARQCAQRHLDRAGGTLKETPEQKRDRDEICAAYYRGG